jgi:hypothetical protein
MDCERTIFTKHALRRMQQRQIPPSAVLDVIERGEIIEERVDEGDKVFTLLGFSSGRALHIVVCRTPPSRDCIVKTAYDPYPEQWRAGFRRRK